MLLKASEVVEAGFLYRDSERPSTVSRKANEIHAAFESRGSIISATSSFHTVPWSGICSVVWEELPGERRRDSGESMRNQKDDETRAAFIRRCVALQ